MWFPTVNQDKLGRKHKDSTPKGSASPNASADHLAGEVVSPLRQVLINDQILALRIKDDELKRIRDSCIETEEKDAGLPINPVVVRRAKPASERKRPLLVFNVGHDAPPNAITETQDYVNFAGPQLDENGRIIPHSILGEVEDFVKEAELRGDSLPLGFSRSDVETSDDDFVKHSDGSRAPSVMTWKRPRTTSGAATPLNPLLNENKALDNYKSWQNKRAYLQRHLCDVTNRDAPNLAMNQGESYRALQERRAHVDRALPAYDYGKGYRVGSEFWAQRRWVGGEENGICTTLNATEQGRAPPFLHVGKARAIQEEQGVAPGRAPPASAGGKTGRSKSFETLRIEQVGSRIDEIDPIRNADVGEIVIVGNQDHRKLTSDMSHVTRFSSEDGSFIRNMEDVDEQRTEVESVEPLNILDAFPDVKPLPIIGPSLVFAGQSAKWTGDDKESRGTVAHEARINFQTDEGARDASMFHITNNGTTVLYFNWKKIYKPNYFNIQREKVQRFYFNAQNGVILPGDTLSLNLTFKSPKAGIFSESWHFETRPVVAGGAKLIMTLRGVCLKEDKNKEGREAIEAEIRQRHHESLCRRVLHQLVGSLTVPDRPKSPIDAYLTEQEIFTRKNPGLFWNSEAIYELKYLYMSYYPEEERVTKNWDYSLDSLKSLILALDEEDERKHVFLQRLNRCIITLSFPPFTPKQKHMYSIVYQLLLEMTDSMVSQSMLIRSTMGLPEKDTAEELPDSELFGRESGKARDKKGASGSGKKRSKESKESTTTSKTKTVKEESPDARADVATTPSGGSAALDSIDPNIMGKYRDKLYIQTYILMTDTFERLDDMCAEIRDVEAKTSD